MRRYHIGYSQMLGQACTYVESRQNLCCFQTCSRDLEEALGKKSHVCCPNKGMRMRICRITNRKTIMSFFRVPVDLPAAVDGFLSATPSGCSLSLASWQAELCHSYTNAEKTSCTATFASGLT